MSRYYKFLTLIFGVATLLADQITRFCIELRVGIVLLLLFPLLLSHIVLKLEVTTDFLADLGYERIKSESDLREGVMDSWEEGLKKEDIEQFVENQMECFDQEEVIEKLYQRLKQNPPIQGYD